MLANAKRAYPSNLGTGEGLCWGHMSIDTECTRRNVDAIKFVERHVACVAWTDVFLKTLAGGSLGRENRE